MCLLVSDCHAAPDRHALRTPARLWLALGLILTLLTSAAGCNTLASAEGEDGEEHHLPAHRPVSFAALLDDLPQRIAVLRAPSDTDAADPASVSPDALQRRYAELVDIVQWIPELAAESGLKKREWDEVQRLAQMLHGALLASVQTDQRGTTTGATPRLAASAEVDQFVDQLEAYRDAAQRDLIH